MARHQRPRIYLAGPEVFLRKPEKAGAAKVAICAAYGIDGKYPLDPQIDLTGLSTAEIGRAIFQANVGLLAGSDGLIANLTPFRGPGLDAGTAWEVGFMHGQGRPVFGYTNTDRSFFDRVKKFDPGLKRRKGADPTMAFEDCDNMGVEQFGFAENLMIEVSVRESGGAIVRGKARRRDLYTDLTAFEICVRQIAAAFGLAVRSL